MLAISKAAEDFEGSSTINIERVSSKKNNLARLDGYYPLQNQEVDESEGTSSPDNSSDLMTVESRLLSARSNDWDVYGDRDGDGDGRGEDTGNDETEALKKFIATAIPPRASQTSQASYSLPTNYEYPELVKSLKNVYKEMFITIGLYVLNIVSAVGIVLVNKFIYTHYKFPHGLVLTLYHFVLTSIGLQFLAAMRFFPIKPVSLLKILPLSISFCSYVVLTNLSLQYNSGTFYQILVAPVIALLQFLFFGIKTELTLLPPMVIMLTGVGIATLTELKPSFLGLSIAFSGIFMTAIYQILVGTKQKQLGLSAIQLLYYQAPLSSVLLAAVAPFLTDLTKVISFEYSSGLVAAIVTSAFCAFFLNLSMYLVLGRSAALTYNVIGLSKLFLVLFLNYWLFERTTSPNVTNLFGVLLAFAGVCSFSFVKFKLMLQENNALVNKNHS